MDPQAKIRALVTQVSGKKDLPGDDESLFDAGTLDSFALTDLVAAIEKEFQIRIPDADLNPRKFDNITRISEYVESRTA